MKQKHVRLDMILIKLCFLSPILPGSEKTLLCKGLQFAIKPKMIDYADILLQFELLYRDTPDFDLSSENRDFLKNKLKDICTLKMVRF